MSDVSKPRILILTRVYPPVRASSGRLARELARALARDDFRVRVIATDQAASKDMDGPVELRRIACMAERISVMGGLYMVMRLFWAALFAPRADVLITLSDPPLLGLAGFFVSKIRRMRHIHWVQDVYPDLLPVAGVKMQTELYRVLYRLSRIAMNSADRVVATGLCMKSYLETHGVRPDRLAYIPAWPERVMSIHHQVLTNGGSVDDQDERLPSPTILDDVPKFRVLHVGTVGFGHPVATILDAATILESMHPEIEFIFIGNRAAQTQIMGEKTRRGLSNIRILPFQPQSRLRDIMESGDIHILSMAHEAAELMAPAKLYAALAAARPCVLVGPDEGDAAQLIRDFGAGSVVPQGAAQALAQVIIDYRLQEKLWFSAHDGAMKAAAAYPAEDLLKDWALLIQDIANEKA